MWVLHHCLAFHGDCSPQSWADLGELLAALVVIFGVVVFGVIVLLLFLNWLDSLI